MSFDLSKAGDIIDVGAKRAEAIRRCIPVVSIGTPVGGQGNSISRWQRRKWVSGRRCGHEGAAATDREKNAKDHATQRSRRTLITHVTLEEDVDAGGKCSVTAYQFSPPSAPAGRVHNDIGQASRSPRERSATENCRCQRYAVCTVSTGCCPASEGPGCRTVLWSSSRPSAIRRLHVDHPAPNCVTMTVFFLGTPVPRVTATAEALLCLNQ